MSYCVACGVKLIEGAKYCQMCGTPISASEISTDNRTEFAGKVFKCPNCGDTINAFVRNCPSCGHELRGTGSSASIQEFARKLAEIGSDSGAAQKGKWSRRKSTYDKERERISLIQSFPIPNTYEDILEFMILASSNIDMANPETAYAKAWRSKVEQAYDKAVLTKGDERKLQLIVDKHAELNKAIKRKIWRNHYGGIILAVSLWVFSMTLLVVTLTISNANERSNEDKRLTALSSEIASAISNGDYYGAADRLEYLHYSLSNNEEQQKWDLTRSSYLREIEALAKSKGITAESPFSSVTLAGMDFTAVKDQFEKARFVLIDEVPLNDLSVQNKHLDGRITEVTIGGVKSFNKFQGFTPTDKVIITYHSMKRVNPPKSSSYLNGDKYLDAEALFRKSGFSDIRTQPVDRGTKSKTVVGEVSSVSIDGDDSFGQNDSYPIDAMVVIYYYQD